MIIDKESSIDAEPGTVSLSKIISSMPWNSSTVMLPGENLVDSTARLQVDRCFLDGLNVPVFTTCMETLVLSVSVRSQEPCPSYLSSPGSIRLACPIINTDDDPTSQKNVDNGAANQRRGIPS